MDKPDLSRWSPEVAQMISERPYTLQQLSRLYEGFRLHLLKLADQIDQPTVSQNYQELDQQNGRKQHLTQVLSRQKAVYVQCMGVPVEESAALLQDVEAMIAHKKSLRAA